MQYEELFILSAVKLKSEDVLKVEFKLSAAKEQAISYSNELIVKSWLKC